jgi:hypothetical protein
MWFSHGVDMLRRNWMDYSYLVVSNKIRHSTFDCLLNALLCQ